MQGVSTDKVGRRRRGLPLHVLSRHCESAGDARSGRADPQQRAEDRAEHEEAFAQV